MVNCIDTPLKLGMLLDFYTSFTVKIPVNKIHRDARTELYVKGLIDRGDDMASITDKGRFYVQRLLTIPYPERTYYIPEK